MYCCFYNSFIFIFGRLTVLRSFIFFLFLHPLLHFIFFPTVKFCYLFSFCLMIFLSGPWHDLLIWITLEVISQEKMGYCIKIHLWHTQKNREHVAQPHKSYFKISVIKVGMEWSKHPSVDFEVFFFCIP